MKSKQLIISCKKCHKDFLVYPYRAKSAKFCSMACRNISYNGLKHSGERRRKMSLARGGTGIPQRSTKRYYHLMDNKYKQWRSRVFQRDNWTCQTCGAKSSEGKSIYLEPHHIKGWAKYPKLRYEISNGITLCKECHKLTRREN